MFKDIKIVCFDADDTLWQNEIIFRRAHKKFLEILAPWGNEKDLSAAFYRAEIKNLPIYGYGIKAFTLSLIEAAIDASKGQIVAADISKLLDLSKNMLKEPIVLLDGVEKTLKALTERYKVVVATKGDLMDQERKVYKSGMGKYLTHVEVMSEKNAAAYERLIQYLGIKPSQFVMIGNSLKSDILPALEAGARAIYIPFDIIWHLEEVPAEQAANKNFTQIKKIEEVLDLL